MGDDFSPKVLEIFLTDAIEDGLLTKALVVWLRGANLNAQWEGQLTVDMVDTFASEFIKHILISLVTHYQPVEAR